VNPSAAATAAIVATRVQGGASDRVAAGATAAAHRVWRHRFACFQVACTWLLIVAGASVTSHDAGLAVPDWPTSYGWINPFAVPLVGNIFYEHGHRMVAAFVGLLTTIEAIWLWRTAERPLLRRLAVLLFVLVCVQGLLGGITVKYFLPPIVSITHGMIAQSFFCLSIATAYQVSREWGATAPRADAGARRLQRVALVAAGAVYVQLLLGAVVRHCWKKEMPDEAFPPRFSDLLPPFAGPPVSGGLSAAILIHGAFAVVVTVALLFAARHVATERRDERRLTRVALALVGLVVVQIGLGLLTFATRTNPNVTTTHVVVGATILGGATLLVLRSFRAAAAEPSP
jgi:cytochrome c oxidase assembly protein subunit 15